MQHQLHSVTPLIQAPEGTKPYLPNCEVYFKMESSQPSGSFKMRGISYRSQKAVQEGCKHLLIASGGNAAIALAYSAYMLGVQSTVVVPQKTNHLTIRKLEEKNAKVVLHGHDFQSSWDKADELAKEMNAVLVHPYDDPDVWVGHTSLVDELVDQLPSKPCAIVLSVGGGGLLCGVLEGLKKNGWSDVPVICMETKGADCLNLSVNANEKITMDRITSIATTLGARSVTDGVMERLPHYNIISEVVTDKQAVESCLIFNEMFDVIVEPACGAALAALYFGVLSNLESMGRLKLKQNGPVVFIVCGGSGTSLEQLKNWAETL